jgi:two-component sensor histidine kinase
MSSRKRKIPEWGHEDLRRAVDAAGVALWTWNLDTDSLEMDPRGYELWDIEPVDDLTFEHLSEKIHPADRDRVREAFSATKTVDGDYEIDFRTLTGNVVRWISARGQGGNVGIVGRTKTGIFLDITGRKQAEESNELLAGEMSHRVKNLLAIAAALTKITGRSSTSIEDMSRQLTQRLTALGRAHDLVRPLPGDQGEAALLGDLISVLLAPYDEEGAYAGRIRVAVPRMGIGESSATSLALIVHELATNSLKYGALSVESGTLVISGTQTDAHVEIVWTEHGGPDVVIPKSIDSYGSKMIRRTVEFQLGGTVDYDWSPHGLVVTLRVAAERLAN